MGTQGSASVGSNATYMSFLPVTLQQMADVKLVVEGVELPAHKTILAANSKVFAELFTSQAAGSSQSEVPLADESLQDTTIALTYLYRNCVPSTDAQSVDSLEARALIRFGHKYGMQGMLDAVESVLISYLQQDFGKLIDDNADIATWTATAEKYGPNDNNEGIICISMLGLCQVCVLSKQVSWILEQPLYLLQQLSGPMLLFAGCKKVAALRTSSVSGVLGNLCTVTSKTTQLQTALT